MQPHFAGPGAPQKRARQHVNSCLKQAPAGQMMTWSSMYALECCCLLLLLALAKRDLHDMYRARLSPYVCPCPNLCFLTPAPCVSAAGIN